MQNKVKKVTKMARPYCHPMNQLEKLNYIITEYADGNYSTETFCDEYVLIVYYEKDGSIVNDLFEIFERYANIFARFSPHESDTREKILFDEKRIKKEFLKLLGDLKDME